MNDSPWCVVVSMKMQRHSIPADYIHGIGIYECPLSTKREVMRQVEADPFLYISPFRATLEILYNSFP
jgi:hypothetical protein